MPKLRQKTLYGVISDYFHNVLRYVLTDTGLVTNYLILNPHDLIATSPNNEDDLCKSD